MTVLEQIVSHYESLHDGDLHMIGIQPKLDPILIWTEGYGRVVRDEKGNMIKGLANKALAYKFAKIHTVEQALAALAVDLENFSGKVDSLHIPLKSYEHDALVSFSYNVGFEALKDSTLLELIKSKVSPVRIDIEFRRWNKGGGKVLAGLTARRESESLLFIKGILKYFN